MAEPTLTNLMSMLQRDKTEMKELITGLTQRMEHLEMGGKGSPDQPEGEKVTDKEGEGSGAPKTHESESHPWDAEDFVDYMASKKNVKDKGPLENPRFDKLEVENQEMRE